MFSDKLVFRLKNAYSVTVLTGAGISAESGIPTFRGAEGLWSKFKPEDLANLEAFLANPKLVWEWYQYRKKIIQEAKPNMGHIALAEFQKRFGGFQLVTQNVDGLHQRAGNTGVIELHGNIMRTRCLQCGNIFEELKGPETNGVPSCEKCGGVLRPDVVWFGEFLSQEVLGKAQTASATCEVFICIGTSGFVAPANTLPAIAKANGSYLVEINIEKTDISSQMDEMVIGKAGEVLPKLALAIKKK